MKKTPLIVAVLLLVAGMLQADVVTYSNSVAMGSSQDATFTLQKFDTTLGTLTGVYLEYWSFLSDTRIQMDNDAESAQTANAKIRHINFALTQTPSLLRSDLSGSLSASELSISTNKLFSLAATTGDDPNNFNATLLGDYANWQPGVLSKYATANISSLVWSGYEYAGTDFYSVTANAEINTAAEYSGADGRVNIDTPTGRFAGQITYTYSPIPEPATALLFGLGGMGAWFLRRNKLKSKEEMDD